MFHIYIIDEYISSQKNGIGTYINELKACISDLNVSICIISFNNLHGEFTLGIENGIKFMRFPLFGSGNFLKHPDIVVSFLSLYIKDSKSNIFIINHTPCTKLLAYIRRSHPLSLRFLIIHNMGWTGFLLGDVNRLREIIDTKEMNGSNEENKKVIDLFEEEIQMYLNVDKIITLSDRTYEILRTIHSVPVDKIIIIKNGLEDSFEYTPLDKKIAIKKQFHLDLNEKVLLYAGRLCRSKGVYVLLESFAEVLKEYPNCRLVLAGSLPQDDEILSISKLVSSRISFLGRLTKEELYSIYRISDIGILPSYSEQCSYTGIEMMMYAIPVVASDGFGVTSMFQDNKNAIIAHIENRNDSSIFKNNLTKAILKLLNNQQLRTNLGAYARQIYDQQYHIRHMKIEYQKLINSILVKSEQK